MRIRMQQVFTEKEYTEDRMEILFKNNFLKEIGRFLNTFEIKTITPHHNILNEVIDTEDAFINPGELKKDLAIHILKDVEMDEIVSLMLRDASFRSTEEFTEILNIINKD